MVLILTDMTSSSMAFFESIRRLSVLWSECQSVQQTLIPRQATQYSQQDASREKAQATQFDEDNWWDDDDDDNYASMSVNDDSSYSQGGILPQEEQFRLLVHQLSSHSEPEKQSEVQASYPLVLMSSRD
jgi:hypothetical protein